MKNKFSHFSALSSALLFFAHAAYAEGPVAVMTIGPAMPQYTAAIATPIMSSITASTAMLKAAIGQSSDALRAATVGANADIATQVEQRQVNAIKQQKKYEAQQAQQPASDACASQTHAAYAGTVLDISKSIASSSSARMAARVGNAPVAQKQLESVESEHQAVYCDKLTDPTKCANSPNPNGAPNGRTDALASKDTMSGADTRSDALFIGAGSPGRSGNLTFTPAQQRAADAFVMNAVSAGSAPRKLSPAEYNNPDNSGKQYEGLRLTYAARTSIAQDYLTGIAAQRKPMAGSAKVLDDLAQTTQGSYVERRRNQLKPFSASGDLSERELLDIEIMRRADNPEWHTFVNGSASPSALVREQTLMMAMSLKMQYQQMKSIEIATALAAIQSAEATKTNLMPQIKQAESSVLRSASKITTRQ